MFVKYVIMYTTQQKVIQKTEYQQEQPLRTSQKIGHALFAV